MTASLSDLDVRWQVPALDSDRRWIGGAAAAIATEIGVQPLVIRGAFAFLALTGIGLVLYPLTWASLVMVRRRAPELYVPRPKAPSSLHRHLAVAMATLGLAIFSSSLGLTWNSRLLWPAGLAVTGVLVAWSRDGDEGGVLSAVRVAISAILVAAGALTATLLVQALTFSEAVAFLLVALVVFGGVVLVVMPTVTRMGRAFDEERQQRVRADERSRMAAHLHDSVLQTLTLIQRHSDDPTRMSQLARQQERELRQWLFAKPGPRPGTTRLEKALQEAADRVEEHHQVRVDVVAVGDTEDLDPNTIEPLIAAAQEAMTNAANHAQVTTIDVYAERRPNGLDVFVRDSGVGFDPDNIDDDRRGIRSSILERMTREGGSAVIHSEPGLGTEVELSLPLLSTADRAVNAASGDTQ